MDKKFIRRIRESIRVFDRELHYQDNASCCNGISLAQCHALLEIEKSSMISVSDLADRLSLDKSTVSRTVEGLVNNKLVDRSIPKENRRKALISLTTEGKQTCSGINSANDGYILNALQDFSDEEREEFLRLFDKMAGSMRSCRLQQTGC